MASDDLEGLIVLGCWSVCEELLLNLVAHSQSLLLILLPPLLDLVGVGGLVCSSFNGSIDDGPVPVGVLG